jgi:hypothetical protein
MIVAVAGVSEDREQEKRQARAQVTGDGKPMSHGDSLKGAEPSETLANGLSPQA